MPLFERVLRVAARASDGPHTSGHGACPTPGASPLGDGRATVARPESRRFHAPVGLRRRTTLAEFLKKAGAGDRFACTVVSYRDGPLREALERRGVAVHVTDVPRSINAEAYEGRITELATLVAGGGHNVALVNTAPVFSGADVAIRLSLPTVWAVHESFARGS